MILASNASLQAAGDLGLGPPATPVGTTNSSSILDLMVAQGLIATRTFSLWMDDDGTSSMSSVFSWALDDARFRSA